jgi:predicted GNAT superfamily acetyltransferase
MEKSKIEIRALTEFKELAELEALQRTAWDDPTAVVYRNTLINMARNGGIVLGALDNGRIVGFVLGYLGIESPEADRPAMANLKLVSQRMAVLPEYRNQGIGYELKLAQRNYAIKQGIRLITWTYDPLQTRNAHLNVRKLGAIARDYWRDYYGTEPSPQVVLGSSDRMMIEWWVTSNRVEQRLAGKRGGLALSQYTEANAVILNPSRAGNNGFPHPCDLVYRPQAMVVLVEIPDHYGDMTSADPELARAWREHTRGILEQTLAAGYAVTDFVRGTHEGRERSFYALSIAEPTPQFGFSSN